MLAGSQDLYLDVNNYLIIGNLEKCWIRFQVLYVIWLLETGESAESNILIVKLIFINYYVSKF